MTRTGDDRRVDHARQPDRDTRRVLQRASDAFDRGDRYMHVQQPIRLDDPVGAARRFDTSDRASYEADLLGALSDIGWELEHVAYVPVADAARRMPDAALAAGGTVVGIYLLQADRRPRPYPRRSYG